MASNYNDNALLNNWNQGDTPLGIENGVCSVTWRNGLLQTFKRCTNARNRVFRHTVRNNRCYASLQLHEMLKDGETLRNLYYSLLQIR